MKHVVLNIFSITKLGKGKQFQLVSVLTYDLHVTMHVFQLVLNIGQRFLANRINTYKEHKGLPIQL